MLFNEPKLLKYEAGARFGWELERFSALQRAEIAEMFVGVLALAIGVALFQCSSTSRNC